MMLLRYFLLPLLLLLVEGAAAAEVWVMADPGDNYHRAFFEALQARVGRTSVELSLHGPTDPIPGDAARPEMIVTLGEKSAAHAVDWPGPLLHVFITEGRFRALYPRGVPRGHGAVFLDQPVARHLALVKVSLRHVQRLVVPVAENSRADLETLRRAAARLGLQLQAATVASPQALDELLERADPAKEAILLLPEAGLRSNAMIKVGVIGAYRRRLPLVAYSEGLVMAGALMAVHTTIPLLADEVAGQMPGVLAGGLPSQASYPDGFEVSVNFQLAKSLNLQIPAASILALRVREAADE